MSTVPLPLSPSMDEPVVDGMLPPQTILASRYRVLTAIGSGGMGSVYLGEHLSVGRKVAIKVLHQEWSAMPAVAARFEAEARTASAIGHPGIVDVLDAGALPDGRLYLVMEYLSGRDLDRELAEDGPLPPIRACRLIRAAAHAIAAAHAAGIVHRDLKPDNILVATRAGEEIVKVLDFGIAADRRHTRFNVATTAPGTMIGTPEHMPPEQAIGDEVGPHFDIYALSSTLFTLLTGDPPFVDDNPLRLLAAKQSEAPPSLEELVEGLPEALVELVDDALAINIDQRPATMVEFIERLDVALRELDPSAPVVTAAYASLAAYAAVGASSSHLSPPPSSSASAAPHESMARTILASTGEPSRPRVNPGVLAIAGALALGLVAVVWGGAEEPTPTARPRLAIDAASAPAIGPEARPPGPEVDPPASTSATATDPALVLPADAAAPLLADAARPTPTATPTATPTPTVDTGAEELPAPTAIEAATAASEPPDAIAPAPDDRSAPATVIKRPAIRERGAEHQTPRCEQLREQTRVARDAYRWKTVLELASQRRCWARSADARKLETQAMMETGDFAGCVAASTGLNDAEVARWRELCRKRGGLG
ncbi:MAG: protein kinase [Nannocystaceae bacterium]